MAKNLKNKNTEKTTEEILENDSLVVNETEPIEEIVNLNDLVDETPELEENLIPEAFGFFNESIIDTLKNDDAEMEVIEPKRTIGSLSTSELRKYQRSGTMPK